MAFNPSDKHLDAGEKPPMEKSGNHPDVHVPVYSDVELVSETDLSFGAILKGTAANPLTTFEKKAALINAELDKFGLGRYQMCIWFLCGFGYFLDLAWSQGVGLIASAIYQEMNVAEGDTGTIFACANAGLAIGALGFGLAVDVIGRKWAFNLTCLITSIFGLLLVCCSTLVHCSCPLMVLGRPKVQLWCHMRNILSGVTRTRRQHPNRCDYRPRIPPTKPSFPRPAPFHVAAYWRCGSFRDCVRYRC